jgi:hypothetical protein
MISTGSSIVASDFVGTPSGASDSGKVPKLNSAGRIPSGFLTGGFSGTGEDGALSISSGTTTLDFNSEKVLIKNYSSVSITGTAALAFSNPHANGSIFILKSIGDVTITSTATRAVDLRSCGALGGGNGSNTGQPGNDGVAIGCPYPTGGVAVSLASTSALSISDFATTGAIAANMSAGRGARISSSLALRGAVFAAAGGASGGSTGSAAGKGGRGGGGMLLQCGGALNISSTFDASGAAGDNASGSGTGSSLSGCGGRGGGGNKDSTLAEFGGVPTNLVQAGAGGGGGCFTFLAASITANTATFTVTGGAAGTTGSGGKAASAGGDGYSFVGLNTELT